MAAINQAAVSITDLDPPNLRVSCVFCCVLFVAGVQGRKRVWALTKNKVWWHSKWFYDAIQVPSPSP